MALLSLDRNLAMWDPNVSIVYVLVIIKVKATRDSYAEFRNIILLWWSLEALAKSRLGVSWRIWNILGYYSSHQNVINPNEHQAFWNAYFPSNIITLFEHSFFYLLLNEILLYQEGRTLEFLCCMPRGIFRTLQINYYCGNFKTAVVKIHFRE